MADARQTQITVGLQVEGWLFAQWQRIDFPGYLRLRGGSDDPDAALEDQVILPPLKWVIAPAEQ